MDVGLLMRGLVIGFSIAAAVVMGGVFVGSALWWLLLSSGIHATRELITPPMLRWINYISGAIIFGFGALALISGL